VKEAQREEQPLKSRALLRRVEEIGIAYRILPQHLIRSSYLIFFKNENIIYLIEGSHNIRAQPFRRLIRHLHAVLQNADRKVLDRVARQPQPEVRMHCFLCEALAYLHMMQSNEKKEHINN